MLSDTFKYISKFRHDGHQVGRKIGDLLELLTFSALKFDENITDKIRVEPKLFGFSEAGHKVEFIVEKKIPEKINGGEIKDLSKISGFIECKKVGVEQTVNSSFKKNFKKHTNRGFHIPYNETINIGFRVTDGPVFKFNTIFDNKKVQVIDETSKKILIEEELENYHRLIFAVTESNQCHVLGNHKSLRSIQESLKSCRILDIYEVLDDELIGVLNDCLSGPQTPEKAKQASFVALDVRKRRFNSFDKKDFEKEMPSILVLTEFSHWEAKSLNMVNACIDYNLFVEDELIVETMIAFEEEFGKDFYSFITKDEYQKNYRVSNLVDNIVKQKQGIIFKDVTTKEEKSIKLIDQALSVL